MANSLVRKTGLYFIGNVASRCLSSIIVPIYAVFVSADALGEYDFIFTLHALLCPVAFCAMWEGILKFCLPAKHDSTREAVLSCAIKTSFPLAAIVSLFQICISSITGMNLAQALALAMMILSNGIVTTWQYAARALKKSKMYISSGILGSFINFGSLLVLVCALNGQFVGLAVSYILGQASIFLFLEIRLRIFGRAVHAHADVSLRKKMLAYCVPCIFNLLSMNMLTGLGRLLIMWEFGSTANGMYAFAMKFASIVTALGSIFSMAVIEEGIERKQSESLGEFYEGLMGSLIKLVLSLSIIAVPIIAIFYLLIPESEYAESFYLVPVVLVYAFSVVISTNFGSSFMAEGKTESNMGTTIIGLIVSAITSIALMRLLGLVGVAAGLAAGAFSMMLARGYISMKMLHYRTDVIGFLVLLLIYVAMSGLCLGWHWFGANPLILSIILLLCAVVVPAVVTGLKGIFGIKDSDKARV